MLLVHPRQALLALTALLVVCAPPFAVMVTAQVDDTLDGIPPNPVTVNIGNDPSMNPPVVGWTDGVCYPPITSGISPGDQLVFTFDAHNVYQMASKDHFDTCNFTDATLLAQVGESPFTYTVPPDAMGTILYFACQVGDHCSGGSQKLQVAVQAFWGITSEDREAPVSSFVVGTSVDECQDIQQNAALTSELDQIEASRLQSFCSDPEPVEGEPHTYYRSCLSGPATLTPGGVVNRLFVMQDPFPQDHRVVIGQRTFEFVQDVVGQDDNNNGTKSVIPVPVNQLYVHHLSGSVVFGQGSEGLRQTAPDAPFPSPYGLFSGEDGNTMVFHLIDLRQVDDWLSCIECRCPLNNNPPGTYLDDLTQTGNITGGVNCCSNCTTLDSPTVDYRMRYNITYLELQPEDEPVTDVRMLTADISPVAGGVLEHDVPSAAFLPAEHVSPKNPAVQYLEIVKPFNEIFKEEFFQAPYSGPSTVKLLRCVAHLHVASIEMYLEDVATGERLCDGQTTYGKDPETNQGFLTAVSVSNYDPPKEFPADLMVRFVSEYNATQVHTGVMGYWFLFVAGYDQVSAEETNVTVNLCAPSTCEASLLPTMDMTPFIQMQQQQQQSAVTESRQADGDCVDTLAESPSCTFGGLCDCETFVNAPESTGCNGFYSSAFGDIEVRSVCANYCGCDVTIAVEEAVDTATTTTTTTTTSGNETVDCQDTLAEHPSCTFGGLCDCETFVNAPESTGCGGVYSSPMGDVPINSVCDKYCGCTGGGAGDTAAAPAESPQSSPASTTELGVCKDTLDSHPACRFGGVCSCEEFVNAPESEGCGGVYKSEMGDTVINDVCALYCNACVDKSVEELFEEAYSEVVTMTMQDHCRYATKECQSTLSNLYSCAEEQPGIENVDPMVRTFVVKHGRELALQNAKLGSPSLHVGQEDQTVEMCSAEQEAEMEGVSRGGDTEDKPLEGSSSATSKSPSMIAIGIIFVAFLLV